METDLGTDLDAVILGEATFPLESYNRTNFSMLMIPRRDPLYIVIPMTIIYSLIFITGVIGNVVTFIVIVRNKYMHTATNYYLFSLAISDLLLLVSGLPQEMVSIWCRYPYMFGEVFCILRGLSAETSTNASVLTITAFTVERYVAICHPFLSQTMSKLSRAVKLIVVIWFVALSFAMPQAIQFGVITIDNDPDQAMCTLKRTIIDHSFVLSSVLFFVTPMTVITVLYILIGLKLRKSSMMKKNRSSFHDNGENSNNQRGRYYPTHQQSSKRVLKMLVAVVVAFFICWAPFHAQRLVYTYGSNKDNKPKGAVMKLIYEVITYVSGILYYVSTTINPILYHIMSFKFREAFKDTLTRCTCSRKSKGRRGRRTYFILNRYCQRDALSRRGTQSYDIDNSSNFVRDDSIRSNGLTYDTSLSKYKYRRKTVSVSEATDDSTRTEITQISHKPESPSRVNSQKQFAAVVVQIGKLEFQPDAGNRSKFWRKNHRPSNKANGFWHVFTCIRPGYPKSQIKSSEYCLRSPHVYDRTQVDALESNGTPMIPENYSMNHINEASDQETSKEISSNNISNSSLRDCNCDDLNEEMAVNLPMLVFGENKAREEKWREK
ncbi:hypothetical protein RUM44_009249 [Polyplax serrata]|uniref:G-protein coupled receptors family 1 profile domain-containing protein n=1 Tax=Polyplax serrata TaxID=468196 RepID=A0ABR1AS60_POLSC